MRLIHTQSNFSARAEDVFWTLGKYDIVAVVEAPDDIPSLRLGLAVVLLGTFAHRRCERLRRQT